MKTKKKLLIYPFSESYAPYIVYQDLMEEYFIYKIVIPEGYQRKEKDIAIFDNRENIKIEYQTRFQEAMSQCDAVLICNGNYSNSFQKVILQNIVESIRAGKDILLDWKIELVEIDELRKIDPCVKIIELFNLPYVESSSVTQNLYKTNAVTVFVGALFEKMNTLDVVLGLTSYFKKKEKKVVTITDSTMAQLFNCKILPSFVKNEKDYFVNKVFRLNGFIKQLDEQYAPDIIVCEIPGGMLKYNEKYHNDFGIYGILFSNAVRCDYFALCIPINLLYVNILSNLDQDFMIRYGYSINWHIISNREIDQIKMHLNYSIGKKYCTMEKCYTAIEKIKSFANIENISTFSPDDIQRIGEDIIRNIYTDVELMQFQM